MHTISSYHCNRPTHTQTNPQTGPITKHCAAKLSVQCHQTNLTRTVTASKPRSTQSIATLERISIKSTYPQPHEDHTVLVTLIYTFSHCQFSRIQQNEGQIALTVNRVNTKGKHMT